jgi:hypothetical protein
MSEHFIYFCGSQSPIDANEKAAESAVANERVAADENEAAEEKGVEKVAEKAANGADEKKEAADDKRTEQPAG